MAELLRLAVLPRAQRESEMREVVLPPPLCDGFERPDRNLAIQAHQARFRANNPPH